MNREPRPGLQGVIVVLLILNAVGIAYLIYKGLGPRGPGGAAEAADGTPRPEFSRMAAPPPAPLRTTNPVAKLAPGPATTGGPKVPEPGPAPTPGSQGNPVQQTRWNSSLAATQPASGSSGSSAAGASPLVTGRVLIRGTVPPEREIRMDEVCGRLSTGPGHFLIKRGAWVANLGIWE